MYRTCITNITQESQIRYTQALLDLMEEKSYKQITSQDICNKANGSRRSFYRYFKNKQGCLCALMDQTITNSYAYAANVSIPMVPHLRGILPTLLYIREHKEFFDRIIRNGLFELYVERVIVCAKVNGIYALRWMGADKSPYQEDAYRFYLSGFTALVKQWHLSGYRRSPEELAEVIRHFFPTEETENIEHKGE